MSVKIGVIADIHMRKGHISEVSDQLEKTVENLRESSPDLVVALGDLIEQESPEKDRENLERVKEIMDFDCPVRFMGGNHDAMNFSNNELEEVLGNELWGVKKVRDEKIIFLNTSSPWLSGSRGEVTDEQLEMLEHEMEKDEQATIFVHHPIHYHDVQESYWWDTYPERAFCGNKKEINRILNSEKVRGVINGHLHEHYITEYKGISHVTLNAFSKETREKPVTGTYAEVRVGEEVEVTVFEDEKCVQEYSF